MATLKNMTNFTSGAVLGGVIMSLAILALISAVGLVYLTKFAFTTQISDDEQTYCVSLTPTQLTLIKLTVVLQWIMLGIMTLSILGGVPVLGSKVKNTFNRGFGSVMLVGGLALIVLYYIGVAKLTKLAYKAQNSGDNYCIRMSKSDFVVCQIVVILMWGMVFRFVMTGGMRLAILATPTMKT